MNVRLRFNPWDGKIDTAQLEELLAQAAEEGAHEIRRLYPNEPDKDFFVTIFDPTTSGLARERVIGMVAYGTNGVDYLVNTLSKAEVFEHVNPEPSETIADFIHCLGDGEFAWRGVVKYRRTVAAGSGLKEAEDATVALAIVRPFINRVNELLNDWLAAKRDRGPHGWFRYDNRPNFALRGKARELAGYFDHD